MASIINAGTTSNTALNMSADTSGTLDLQSNGTTMASVTSTGFNIGGAVASGFTMKNRIINGDMVISQRNGTSSVTPADGAYTLDRWSTIMTTASKFTIQQNAGSVSTLATGGFTNYLGITSSSSYSVSTGDIFGIQQRIEGFNTSDLLWGTANAKTVTLSAWVYSSLTGTFGGSIINSAANYSYPFTYTISTANTWTKISVTIPGPTAGTWIGATNGIGIQVNFGVGGGSTFSGTAGSWASQQKYTATGGVSVVGTNGATWYVTGVQLEQGSQATSFEWLPYSTELALCQRYFQRNFQYINGFVYSSNVGIFGLKPWVLMRASPTLGYTSGASNVTVDFVGGTQTSAATITAGGAYGSASGVTIETNQLSGRTQWQGVILVSETLTLSAEL